MSQRDTATLRSLADRIDPVDAGAHNNLGVVFYQKGLVSEALAAFERALELDPRLEVARRNAEIAFAESGQFDRRVRELRERLKREPGDADTRDTLARVYLLGGDPEGAAREWRKLLEQHPGSTPLHMKLAYAEAEHGRIKVALKLLEAAARLSPELPAVRLQLAELLDDSDMPVRAEREVRRALDLEETNARGHAFLGMLLQRTGREVEAAEALERARELNPNVVDAEGHLSLDRYRAARAARTQQEPGAPEPVAGELGSYARATELRQAGELQSAMAELEGAIAAGDDSLEVRQGLAELQLLQGALDQAAEAYDALLERQEDSPKLWNERGVTLHRRGELDEAVTSYRRAVALDHEYRLGWSNLGVALAQREDPGPAERAFRTAAAGDAPPEVLWNLGLFLTLRGRPEEAVEVYRAALEVDEEAAESWSRLGSALFQARRAEEARDALLEALERDPSLVEARYQLGFALSALGDFRGALRETQRAMEQAPVLPATHYQLLIDVQFEAGTIPAPDAAAGERVESGSPIRAFEFDPSALDEAFALFDTEEAAAGSEPVREAELVPVRTALRQGKLEEAADRIAPIVARAPAAPGPRLLEGQVLLARGLAGEALERFTTVLSAEEVVPEAAREARVGRARALLMLERHQEAVEAARAAAEAGGPVALYGRALLAADRAADAVPVFERAFSEGETESTTISSYGQALLAVGREEDAERAFRRALRGGGSAVARVGLARSLEACGDLEAARRAYRDAVRTLPSYGPAALGLAELEWRGGRAQEAVRPLIDLLTLDPVNVEVLARLGILLMQVGDTDRAGRALRRALSLAPDHGEARRHLSELDPGERA